jgi:hypothetical protein
MSIVIPILVCDGGGHPTHVRLSPKKPQHCALGSDDGLVQLGSQFQERQLLMLLEEVMFEVVTVGWRVQ